MSMYENPSYYFSAYGIAVKYGFQGTPEEWLESLKGEKGDPVLWKGQYDTLAELQAAHPTGSTGDCYLVGTHLYWWDKDKAAWDDAGSWQGPQGIPGKDGVDGLQGLPGPPGKDGADGADGAQGIQGPPGKDGAQGIQGETGADGTTYTPAVSADGTLSWTNDGGEPNPEPVNIKGPPGQDGADGAQGIQGPPGQDGANGQDGENGATFTPSVSEAGVLSWANDKGLPNPEPVNIKGTQGDTGPTGTPGTDGIDGSDGVGIQSVQRTEGDGAPGTSDTYTITLTNGETSTFTVYNGADGTSFVIKGRYGTLDELMVAHPTGSEGEAWAVGSAADNDVYLWDVDKQMWTNIGSMQGPPGPQGPAGKDGADGAQGIQGPPGQDGAQGVQGETGADGTTYTPAVSADGTLSWTNDGGKPNPEPANIKGPPGQDGADGAQGVQGPPGQDGANGQDGENGATFTPSVSEAGVLSWANDKGLPNPASVDIKGPAGAAGQDGAPGPAGADGAPGTDGKTAYQYAVDGGYTGTEAEFQALMGTGPWLPLSGGELTGNLVLWEKLIFKNINTNNEVMVRTYNLRYSGSTSPRFVLSIGKVKSSDTTEPIVLNGVSAPIGSTDAANKKYVDDLVGGIAAILDTINGEVA